MTKNVVKKGKIEFTPCRVKKGRPGAGTFAPAASCSPGKKKVAKKKVAKKKAVKKAARRKPALKTTRRKAAKKPAKRKVLRNKTGKFRTNLRKPSKANAFRASSGACMRRLKNGKAKFAKEGFCKSAGV